MSEKKHKERRRRERAKKEEPKVNKISFKRKNIVL